MSMNFMPNCNEVARLIASGEIERAGIWKRFSVALHFRMCRCCPHYVTVLKKTIALFREQFSRPIPDEEIRRLSDSITRRLLNGG